MPGEQRSVAEDHAERYYDSSDADRFYELIWGGEDIHIGLYEDSGTSLVEASRNTVSAMADRLARMELPPGKSILDLGAGYGGAARYLAERFEFPVVCVNLSEVQNERNRRLNRERNLDDRIKVLHGSFEAIPATPESVDVVWSQDAFLHSSRRSQVVSEICRVLKPGGHVLFTDPMQADNCAQNVLQPVYDRLGLESLASPAWYRREFAREGLIELEWHDLSADLHRHYATVRSSLRARYELLKDDISPAYMDRMLVGLNNWVTAASAGYLRWGIFHFHKPASA